MGLAHSPRIVTDGLVLSLDAGSPKNYNVGVSTNWTDRVGGNNGTLVGEMHHTDGPFVGAGYVEFDGTGDAISVPAGSDFAYGTGDFTIEGWFYPTVIGQVTGASASGNTLFAQTVGGSNYLLFGVDANGKLYYIQLNTGGNSTSLFSSAPNGSVVVNQWQHIALCRNSGTLRVFVDGALIDSVSHTFDYTNTTYNPTIGNYTHTFDTQPFNGYVSNFRVVKGTGLYTSNFTPPKTALTAVTNTVLLTCQGNSISDASSSAHSISVTGDAAANLGSPASAFVFDGTNDYVTISDDSDFTFGTGDLTVEAWFKPDSSATVTNYHTIISCGWPLQLYWHDTQFKFWASSDNSSGGYFINGSSFNSGSNSAVRDVWHHIVVTRSGSDFKMYLNGELVSSASSSSSFGDPNADTKIGQFGPSNSNFADGEVSNVKLYKGKALTAAEVTQNYNALKGRYA